MDTDSPLHSLPSMETPHPAGPKNELLPWERLWDAAPHCSLVIQLWAHAGTAVSLHQKMSALP